MKLVICGFVGVWSSAPVTGSRPPPCTSFTMTMINDHSVILFGGRQSEQRYNHSYILDLEQMVHKNSGAILVSL